MKRLPGLILYVALATVSVSCINSDYDLDKLDTSVTLLPGLSITVNSDNEELIGLNKDFIDAPGSHTTTKEDGTIVIGKKEENRITVSPPTDEEIDRKLKFEPVILDIPGKIELPVATEFKRLLKECRFTIPLQPMIEVENPLTHEMEFTAEISCENVKKEIGPLPIKSGRTTIGIIDDDIRHFFTPIKGDITISEMKLTCKEGKGSSNSGKEKSAAGGARKAAESRQAISIYGYLPLELQESSIAAGEPIIIEYSLPKSDLDKLDMNELKEKYGFEIPVFTASADITSNIPVALNGSFSAVTNVKAEGPFATDKAVAAGAVGSPATTNVSAFISLDAATQTFSEFSIKLEGVPAQPFSFTTDHTLSYSNLKVCFNEGVTINPK